MFRTVVEPTLLQSIAIANAPVPAFGGTAAASFWGAQSGTLFTALEADLPVGRATGQMSVDRRVWASRLDRVAWRVAPRFEGSSLFTEAVWIRR
jgi:hypothetical protein